MEISKKDFLSCPICCNEFALTHRLPVSLGCGHTICRECLLSLHNRQCPFDQMTIINDVANLPINTALLQLVSYGSGNSCTSNAASNLVMEGSGENGTIAVDSILSEMPPSVRNLSPDDFRCYVISNECIENLALHLRSFVSNFKSPLSRSMQRKLVTLINCQLMEEEGRIRALRAARSLGECTVTDLILQHQNPQQLIPNLWASVRARGCQFLGPAKQEEILKLVLLALEDGTALSRKVLVMFIVERLEPHFPQASKTSIGHVVQLLFRASCFRVSKREADPSLLQLKEEYRTYDALRREHDAQIVQIATEAGLRIDPGQWSSLLYGDTMHKSHMQSIIAKWQTPSSFAQSIQELDIALQRSGNQANLEGLCTHLRDLASIEFSQENAAPTWDDLAKALEAVRQIVLGIVEFTQQHGTRKIPDYVLGQSCNPNTKYKVSLCRDLAMGRNCPRGTGCAFAHSLEELERYRAKSRKNAKAALGNTAPGGSVAYTPSSQNDGYQTPQTHHAYPNSHPGTGMVHPGDETIANVPTVNPSQMSYTTSGGHMYNVAYTDNVGLGSNPQTSSGHHRHTMYQSPISPNNGPWIPSKHALGSIQQTSNGHHRRSMHHSPHWQANGPLLPINNCTTVGPQNIPPHMNYIVLPYPIPPWAQHPQHPQQGDNRNMYVDWVEF